MTTDQIRAEFEKLPVDVYGHYYDHCHNGAVERVWDNEKWQCYLAGFNARQAENEEALDALEHLKTECAKVESAELDEFMKPIIATIKKALGGI